MFFKRFGDLRRTQTVLDRAIRADPDNVQVRFVPTYDVLPFPFGFFVKVQLLPGAPGLTKARSKESHSAFLLKSQVSCIAEILDSRQGFLLRTSVCRLFLSYFLFFSLEWELEVA